MLFQLINIAYSSDLSAVNGLDCANLNILHGFYSTYLTLETIKIPIVLYIKEYKTYSFLR